MGALVSALLFPRLCGFPCVRDGTRPGGNGQGMICGCSTWIGTEDDKLSERNWNLEREGSNYEI